MALESVALLPEVDEPAIAVFLGGNAFYRLDLPNSRLRGHMEILRNGKERTPLSILTDFQYPPPPLEAVHLDRRALPGLLTSLA